MSEPPEIILEVDKLITSFETDRGLIRAVDQVSFSVAEGKTLGIVGESGCGKSVTAMSIVRLLPQPTGKILGGHIYFKGRDSKNPRWGHRCDFPRTHGGSQSTSSYRSPSR